MLPRRVSSSVRTVYEASLRPSCSSASIQHATPNVDPRATQQARARRCIHSSSIRSAVNVPRRERELMAELRTLRKMVEVDEKTQFAKESSAHLPPLTDDTLALLYEAINMPDPPSDEEMRLEDRRRRLLGGDVEPTSLERKMRRASRRIEDVSKRLGELKLISQPKATTEEEDHSRRLVQALQGVREREQREEKEVVDAEKDDAPAARPSLSQDAAITAPSVLAQFETVITSLKQHMPSDSPISLGLLTKQDWRALARWCAGSNQLASFPRMFALMKVSGQGSVQLDVANVALDLLAEEGDVTKCHSLAAIMQEAGLEYDAYTRHCLVKAYIHSERLDEAVLMLRSFANTVPAGLTTYTLTIEALLAQRTKPEVQSRAWSLFTEMRLVAHPIPDAPLYAQMIKACALGVEQPGQNIWKPSSLVSGQLRSGGQHRTVVPTAGERVADTERALDLFREMTTRYDVRPTAEVFTAVILACTRRRDMYHKGIELFQSMLDLERERLSGNDDDMPSFAPSRKAYNSLLQGCARNGDLLRARWVLAEMLRSSMALSASLRRKGDEAQEWEWREVAARRPDEETMSLVLFTYATYKPAPAPEPKQMVTSACDVQEGDTTKQEKEKRTEVRIHDSPGGEEQRSTFSGTQLPGSSLAVLGEADGLMQRIAGDQGDPDQLLSSVKPSGRMLHAYMAVVNAHGGRERLKRMTNALFGTEVDSNDDDPLGLDGASLYQRWGVSIDANACDVVLNACVKTRDRTLADRLAARTWHAWQQNNDRTSAGSGLDVRSAQRTRSFEPVVVGRCWAGMICNEAKSNRLTEAMELLRSFVAQYPPPPTQQQRGSLAPPTPAEAAAAQPLLTFKQLQVLHIRLTARIQATHTFPFQRHDDNHRATFNENRRHTQDLAFLAWATRAYGAVLTPRMPSIIKDAGRYVETYKRA